MFCLFKPNAVDYCTAGFFYHHLFSYSNVLFGLKLKLCETKNKFVRHVFRESFNGRDHYLQTKFVFFYEFASGSRNLKVLNKLMKKIKHSEMIIFETLSNKKLYKLIASGVFTPLKASKKIVEKIKKPTAKC